MYTVFSELDFKRIMFNLRLSVTSVAGFSDVL